MLFPDFFLQNVYSVLPSIGLYWNHAKCAVALQLHFKKQTLFFGSRHEGAMTLGIMG
jgi:hypothetical protein